MKTEFDYILVGGGLQNALLALALRDRRPVARIAIIERDARLGGNHTWCFNESDITAGARRWIDPLVVRAWPGYTVLFPNLRRDLDGPYFAITSDRLHEVVFAALDDASGCEVMLNTRATLAKRREVHLDDGSILRGQIVIDARGPGEADAATSSGFQKFLGLEVTLDRPHGMNRPVLMDATVDQTDGYRFFYVLPLDAQRLLVEDTYFNESPHLDREKVRRAVRAYLGEKGYAVTKVLREEVGVLPMPWEGAMVANGAGPLVAGYRGGYFHPGTGYSLPVAARFAEFIASRDTLDISRDLAGFASRHVRQARYCFFLNRLLFRWYPPHSRRNIFERFYRMRPDTIHRFYALRLTVGDRVRLLAGRPPAGLSMRHRFRRRNRS